MSDRPPPSAPYPDTASVAPAATAPASSSSRRSAWYRVVLVLVLATYPLLALGHFWHTDLQRDDSAHLLAYFTVFMIRTGWFHLGLALAAVVIWAAWRRAGRLLLAALPALLVTVGPELLLYLPRTPAVLTGQACTVMQFNLLYRNPRKDAVLAEIRRADPDVLLLQEYDPPWDEALHPALSREYAYAARDVRAGPFGSAIFSRFPFAGQPEFIPPVGDARLPILRAEVMFDERPMAIYGVHLWPPKGLARFAAQRAGLLHLVELLGVEKRPIIVCGDFNFTVRHDMHQAMLRLGLQDAHDAAGRGRGSTWPMTSWRRFFPGVRVDHIYFGRGLACASARTGSSAGSDHRPVIAEVGFLSDTP
ncbi:MAG TPA: endonuclease/exonuclease/phosphatase family protein [Phycisphaerae bacterium]|nr:endonuclease/exonuclease/phosphatase family protein [Phycisphaerae bacterium]